MPESFIVRGALVYDGCGNHPGIRDVAVKNGRIARLAPAGSLNASGQTLIDANGLSLAPGFIDVHAHSDLTILIEPEADSRICQGITTEIIGNCGSSPGLAPGRQEYLRHGCGTATWENFEAYATTVNERLPATNIVALCGHGSLREAVVGLENRAPSASEMERMKEILHSALSAGAAGFSTGLWYIPGKFASSKEILELASLLKNTGKPYVTHLRNEGDTLIESLDEAFSVAKGASCKLHISHLKTTDPQNWPKIDLLLSRIEEERKNKLAVYADRYPYVHSSTSLRVTLPSPFDLIPDIRRFLDSSDENRMKVVSALNMRSRRDLSTTIFLDTRDPSDDDIRGLTLAQISGKWGVTNSEACVRLLRKNGDCKAAFACMSPDNMLRILAREWVCAGSDGYALPLDDSIFRSHPRSYGAFPLFFRSVSEMQNPAEAIRRMTSLPADIFNIPERGIIHERYIADLTLFDEQKFNSSADFGNRNLMPTGIRRVFVAGRTAFDSENPRARGRFGAFLKISQKKL